MPKDKSSRSLSKSRDLFHKPYSRGISNASSSKEDSAEWEDAICPICMESPHNAVLLLCTSHDKGCRPYMCDTSYRHSNCLDQYIKANAAGKEQNDQPSVDQMSAVNNRAGTELATFMNTRADSESLGYMPDARPLDMASPLPSNSTYIRGQKVSELPCPLCRGKVEGWKVVEVARQHLNFKPRSCAQESCAFQGSYEDLRKHARHEHPSARPCDVDPARQRDWRRLERQRDFGDVLSTIQSAMPGATIIGDYVIDEDADSREGLADEHDLTGSEGNWWTMFFLFQVLGPAATVAGGRHYPAFVRGIRGPRGVSLDMRQSLWGENMDLNSMGGGSTTGAEDRGIGPTRRRRRSRR